MERRTQWVAVPAALAAGLALAAMAGWILGIPRLASLMPGMIPMAPSTALLFGLYAGAVLMRCLMPSRRVTFRLGVVAGTAGVLLSLALLILSLQGIHLAVERLGLSLPREADLPPLGHMSPLTAGCFLLASASFLLSLTARPGSRGRGLAAGGLAALLAAVSLVLLLAYLYGTPLLYGTRTIPPAMTTSLAFLGLSIALLGLARPPAHPAQRPSGISMPTPYALLAIFAALSAGIVVAGYIYSRRSTREYMLELENQLSAIAEMKVDSLVLWRNDHLEDTALLLSNADFVEQVRRCVQTPDDADALQRLRIWLEQVRAISGYEAVFLLTPQGEARLTVPGGAAPPSPSLIARAAEVLRSGQTSFMDFHREAPGSAALLALLAPIPGGKDAQPAVAALALRIDPRADLYPALRRWPSSHHTAETLLLRREDGAAVILNDLHAAPDAALAVRVPLAPTAPRAVEASLDRDGIVRGRNRNGVPVLACVRAVPGSPWFVVVSLELSEIQAPLLRSLWLLLGVVSSLLAGAGAVAAMQWRRETLRAYRQRLAAEEALRENEELFRAVFDRSTIGKTLTSPEGGLIRVNAALAAMLGLTIEELRQTNLIALTHPDDVARSQECMRSLLANERSSYRMEKRYRHWDGHYVWADVSTSLLRGGHGEPVHFITSILDITERKTAEDGLRAREQEVRRLNAELEQRVRDRTAQLEAANKELEAFSYSVSHDLRAPLRHVQGYVDMLARDAESRLSERGRHCMAMITDASREMGELIDDLLAFSRMGRTEMSETVVKLDRLVQDAMAHLEPTLRGRNIAWTIAPLPDVRADPAMLTLVLSNLLSNAVKFTRPRDPARIEIGAAGREGDRTILYVRDNGVGFDPRYAKKLFGVFQRLHRADEFEGTGIGLANVRRIIARHGGRTWAEGKLNEGATFYFTLKEAE